jgi:ATP-dependent Clp protease adaptor protein ClpS
MTHPTLTQNPSTQHDDGVMLDEQKLAIKPPSLYKVLLLNDDYTPMDFVVMILQIHFHKDEDSAIKIMLSVHEQGKGICGVYPKDIAETKVHNVTTDARRAGYPLKCVTEEV